MSTFEASSPTGPFGELLVRWSKWAAESTDATQFLEQALELWAVEAKLSYAAVVEARRGRWETLADFGPQLSLPFDELAVVLDEEREQTTGNWRLVPIGNEAGETKVLAAQVLQDSAANRSEGLRQLAAHLSMLWQAAIRNERRQWRLDRLEAILEIAAQWNQTHEMVPLLQRMAEASTRLLQAERASIFLWDKANSTLVGRPALGVEGKALEIPDDAGLVGRVVQTGEIGRVDENHREDAALVNREVDRQLKFETRTLLCVPLRGTDGAIFGAFEVINKHLGNFAAEDEEALIELAAHAAVALENTQEREQLVFSQRQLVQEAASGVQWVGECPAIESLRKTVERIAPTELAVLILGENGTGKDVVARMTHYLSDRRDHPFVAVNCAAISDTLLESELFGHEKGAFTGAHEDRAGKFETASGGTLFLDEIGDMSLDGQASLLRVLEDKVVVRVGGSRPIATDTRVFAATNQDLVQLVREKKFREDLYYRLNVVTLELPPLRERGEDVLLLADFFLQSFAQRARRAVPKFTAAARRRLLQHPWPGNVRELRNLMERLAYLSDEDRIDVTDLRFIIAPNEVQEDLYALNRTLADATREFQVDFIKRHIEASKGRMTQAAENLGLHRSNLYRKMKQLGMSVDEE
jgi:transcriptional regulator with GAF, ATPase, and Fis domain